MRLETSPHRTNERPLVDLHSTSGKWLTHAMAHERLRSWVVQAPCWIEGRSHVAAGSRPPRPPENTSSQARHRSCVLPITLQSKDMYGLWALAPENEIWQSNAITAAVQNRHTQMMKILTCMIWLAVSNVNPSTTLSSTLTTYSLLLTLSLWSSTRKVGGCMCRTYRLRRGRVLWRLFLTQLCRGPRRLDNLRTILFADGPDRESEWTRHRSTFELRNMGERDLSGTQGDLRP